MPNRYAYAAKQHGHKDQTSYRFRSDNKPGSVFHYVKNHGGDPEDFDPPEPSPTSTLVGSHERISEYRRRLTDGESLWSDDDSLGVDDTRAPSDSVEAGLPCYESRCFNSTKFIFKPTNS